VEFTGQDLNRALLSGFRSSPVVTAEAMGLESVRAVGNEVRMEQKGEADQEMGRQSEVGGGQKRDSWADSGGRSAPPSRSKGPS